MQPPKEELYQKMPPNEPLRILLGKTVLLATFILVVLIGFLLGLPFLLFTSVSKGDGGVVFKTYYLDIKAPDPAHRPPPQRRPIVWAYSPVDLDKLVRVEEELYKEFRPATNSAIPVGGGESKNFPEIQWWIKDYNESSLKVAPEFLSEDLPKQELRISGHPFLSLRMIRRFKRLTDILSSEAKDSNSNALRATDFFKKLKEIGTQLQLPSTSDVENMMRSILEIQFIYDLHTNDLLIGKFGNVDTDFGLELEEAFELGSFAYRIQMYTEALDWLQTVLTRLKGLRSSPSPIGITIPQVFALIVEVSKKHDRLLQKINHRNYYDHYHRFTTRIGSRQDLLTVKEEDTVRFQASEFKNTKFYPAYTLLCAGKDFLADHDKSRLSCWYDSTSDPAWTLSPIKLEAHSLDPSIIQIYDVIGDKMIDFLRKTGSQNLGMDLVSYGQTKSIYNKNVTTFRTSTSGILLEANEGDRKVLAGFEAKIARMTGLHVTNTTGLHISVYGPGGHFSPHLDTVVGVGDRVTTFMTYLDNVRLGGYTVFPKIGVSVIPKKGSGLFWNNFFRNETTDPRTIHAGCPVILGRKWIATKGIRHDVNFQKRKCALNSTE